MLLVILLAAVTAPATSQASQAAADRAGAGAATCRIRIQGSGIPGGISKASVECTGGPVLIAVNQQLETFQGGFQGFQRDSRCGNTACLLTVCADTRLVITNSSITGVTGRPWLRAVLCVAGGAALTLQGSNITNNDARVVAASGRASVFVRASRLIGNTAGSIGANYSLIPVVVVLDVQISSALTALNASGGAVVATDTARVVIANSSILSGNRCINRPCVGGAVLLTGAASVTIEGTSQITDNTAGLAGGGIAAVGHSRVVMEGGSRVCGNTVVNGSGGGVFLEGSAMFVLTGGSAVCNNSCPVGSGGGVQAQGYAAVRVHNRSMVFGNRASTLDGFGKPGGGMALSDYVTLLVDGRSGIYANSAGVAGGGLALVNHSRAVITGESFISNNTCQADEVLSFGRGGAGILAYGNASLVLTGNSSVTGNRAIDTSGGGIFLAGNASANISGGVRFADNAVSRGFGGVDIATFSHAQFEVQPGVWHHDSALTKCSPSVFLGRVPCQVGEHGASGICQCCGAYTYDIEGGDSPCKRCPDRAFCPGGSLILPEEGHWHSHPKSAQVHPCPIFTSCAENGTCKEGHTGPLCGACVLEEGYGMTMPLQCRKCLPPARQLGTYLAIVFVTVLFVAVTVRFTWQDNKENDNSLRPSDLVKVLVSYLQYMVIISTISVPWPAFLVTLYASATVVFGAASGQALSLDCLLQHYGVGKYVLPIAIQRQLVYFLAAVGNYVSVALLLYAGHLAKRAWHAISTRGAGASAVSGSSKPFDGTKLLVAIPVVLFFAYPTLCKAALTFFACLRIDDANVQPHPEFSLFNHTKGYFVGGDIQQECWIGWHRSWALGLGVPSVLLFCVCVPLGMFFFLWANKGRVADPDFRKYFGFLYRNYTTSTGTTTTNRMVWFESVWAIQTVLMTAVSVFHFTLQAYNALLLLGLVLLVSAVVQVVAKPYAQHRLHRLHLASTLCLILNVWCALAFFSCTGRSSSACFVDYHTAVGAVMVALDALFMAWCVYEICVAAMPLLQSWGQTTTELVQAASQKLKSQRMRRRSSRDTGELRGSLSGLWRQVQRHSGPNGEETMQPALNPVHSAPARIA